MKTSNNPVCKNIFIHINPNPVQSKVQIQAQQLCPFSNNPRLLQVSRTSCRAEAPPRRPLHCWRGQTLTWRPFSAAARPLRCSWRSCPGGPGQQGSPPLTSLSHARHSPPSVSLSHEGSPHLCENVSTKWWVSTARLVQPQLNSADKTTQV